MEVHTSNRSSVEERLKREGLQSLAIWGVSFESGSLGPTKSAEPGEPGEPGEPAEPGEPVEPVVIACNTRMDATNSQDTHTKLARFNNAIHQQTLRNVVCAVGAARDCELE